MLIGPSASLRLLWQHQLESRSSLSLGNAWNFSSLRLTTGSSFSRSFLLGIWIIMRVLYLVVVYITTSMSYAYPFGLACSITKDRTIMPPECFKPYEFDAGWIEWTQNRMQSRWFWLEKFPNFQTLENKKGCSHIRDEICDAFQL